MNVTSLLYIFEMVNLIPILASKDERFPRFSHLERYQAIPSMKKGRRTLDFQYLSICNIHIKRHQNNFSFVDFERKMSLLPIPTTMIIFGQFLS